jgi:hypothetical protein
MHMTMMTMRKACAMAKTLADTAATIRRSPRTRPKSRTIRHARISRTCAAAALTFKSVSESPWARRPWTERLAVRGQRKETEKNEKEIGGEVGRERGSRGGREGGSPERESERVK